MTVPLAYEGLLLGHGAAAPAILAGRDFSCSAFFSVRTCAQIPALSRPCSPAGLLLVSFSVVGLSELPILRDCTWSLCMEGSFLFPLSWLKTKAVLQPCFIKDPDPFSFKEKKTTQLSTKTAHFSSCGLQTASSHTPVGQRRRQCCASWSLNPSLYLSF